MTPAEQARLIDKQEFEAECQAVRRRALQYSKQRRHADNQRIRRWIEAPLTEAIHESHNAEQRERIKLKAVEEGRPTTSRPLKRYTINGEAKTILEWSQIAGISYNAMRHRLEKLDGSASIGNALKRGRLAHGRSPTVHTVNGISKTLQQWADHLGISYETLMARLRNGRSLADAIAMNANAKARPGNGRQPKLYTANGETKGLQQWADQIGITYNSLAKRLEKRTLAEALAMPVGRWKQTLPGVSSDFEGAKGTGAGSTLGPIPNISFEEKPE